ncbi:MAG: MATE family efflux transporter [Desulfurococcales archaeon]|nr:MATE family efflux transporter [Desulfurococcales archaeon]
MNARVEELRDRVVHGSLIRAIISLATPIVAARVLGSIQESVDVIFLGRVGANDLAAPTAVQPLFWLFMGINFGITTATMASVSQYIGARRFREASEIAGRMLGLSILAGLTSMIVLVIVAPLVYTAQGIPEAVYELAMAYTIIDALSLPFMFLIIFFSNLSSGMGDTRKPFMISTTAALINIVLDPILIFGLGPLPRMGVVGAALATSISRFIAGGIAVYMMVSGVLGMAVSPRKPTLHILSLTSRIGGPVAVQRIIVSMGFLVMMGIVARLGQVVMAAYNVSLAIIHIIQSATFGFNIAIATIVGQNLGAGYIDRARKAAYTGITLVFTLLGIGSTIIYLFRGELVQIFTNIESVYEESVRMVEIISIGVPFLGVFFVSNGVARGSGWTGIISALGIARLWLLRIPLAYILVFILDIGSDGVWISMTVSNVIAGIAGILWVVSGRWLKPAALSSSHTSRA